MYINVHIRLCRSFLKNPDIYIHFLLGGEGEGGICRKWTYNNSVFLMQKAMWCLATQLNCHNETPGATSFFLLGYEFFIAFFFFFLS